MPRLLVDNSTSLECSSTASTAPLSSVCSDIAAVGQARLTQRNSNPSKARTPRRSTPRLSTRVRPQRSHRRNMVSTVQNDWTNTITGTLQLTNSPSYAREGGKPVVELWASASPTARHHSEQPGAHQPGFKSKGRLRHRRGAARLAHGLQGKPGFAPVYAALNMVSPWNVGNPTVDKQLFIDAWPS